MDQHELAVAREIVQPQDEEQRAALSNPYAAHAVDTYFQQRYGQGRSVVAALAVAPEEQQRAAVLLLKSSVEDNPDSVEVP